MKRGRLRVLRPATVRYLAAALALALVVALFSVYLAIRSGGRTERAGGATAAERLYSLVLEDAEGKAQPLAQWRGKLLVVNFWATWCTPCVAEMPELDRLQRVYAARNVTIIGIGMEDSEHVRGFRDRLGLHLTLLAGGNQALALAQELGDKQAVLPYTVLLSTKGELLAWRVGTLEPGQLDRWLSAAP